MHKLRNKKANKKKVMIRILEHYLNNLSSIADQQPCSQIYYIYSRETDRNKDENKDILIAPSDDKRHGSFTYGSN